MNKTHILISLLAATLLLCCQQPLFAQEGAKRTILRGKVVDAKSHLPLIGATVVLACFAVIIWRGLHAVMRAPDRFGAFLAIGLTTMIGF